MAESPETTLEYALTHSYKHELIGYMDVHPDEFSELIALALSDSKDYSWRAAWLLWSCMQDNDIRLRPHLREMINLLPARKDNQQREFLIVLQRMEIPEEAHARLFDTCTHLWANLKKNPTLRFHAFKTMLSLSRKYPEFANEIQSLTDSYYIDHLSESLRKSIMKLMKDVIH